jgi:D-alanyl-D-alanine carboxypeptidase
MAVPQQRQVRSRYRRVVLVFAGLLVAGGIAVAVDRLAFSGGTDVARPVFSGESQVPHPALKRTLVGLVSGPSKIAPGAVAYVSGPHGTWLGAAGVADTSTGAQMPVDARMRLESVSKIYTATLILQLAEEGKLRVGDTVARWLPGLLPYGKQITIRELLTMQSGLIDNNDLRNASPREQRINLGRVKDTKLRAKLVAIAARVEKDPATEFSPIWWIRFAAWQPLLFTPGAGGFHYSNIGYDILGLIAARAGGKPLPALYRERIFEPLGLRATAYDPQGPITGPHAHGYGIEPSGEEIDTTDWHPGIGAEGGIVSNAKETATFLTALMRGKLIGRQQLTAMEDSDLWLGGMGTCVGTAYGWSGGGNGFKTEVWVNDGGSRVAVLLLNARHWDTAQPEADQAAAAARSSLYCSA